jgi:hypothetical protein
VKPAFGIVIALALLSSCAHHEKDVLEQVKDASSSSGNGGLTLASEFENQKLVAVEGFHIRSREGAMEKFPCQRCHKVPLVQMKHDRKDGKTRAHWNVEIKHADKAVMNCSTCHDPGDLNQLKTVAGQRVSINASWQVCGQCHFKQVADWKGGSHGKRVAGWAPPRVSKTCVECHNPHKPAWDTRMPVHTALTGVAGGAQ